MHGACWNLLRLTFSAAGGRWALLVVRDATFADCSLGKQQRDPTLLGGHIQADSAGIAAEGRGIASSLRMTRGVVVKLTGCDGENRLHPDGNLKERMTRRFFPLLFYGLFGRPIM